jgi:hypothetical protein
VDFDEALAVCLANLKGTRDKDLLGTARALQYIKSLPAFGSNAKVGQAVGVSGEIVREFLSLLHLPNEIQALFEERQLGLEQGRRLWQINRRRPDVIREVAEAMLGITSVDGRHLVDYLLKHPDVAVSEAKEQILAAKATHEREFHVIALMNEAQYQRLRHAAGQKGMAVNDLVTDIVHHWLELEDVDA